MTPLETGIRSSALRPPNPRLFVGLLQQTKALQEERPQTGYATSKRIESVKHLLWHGNVDEALERLDSLILDLSLIQAQSAPAKKLAACLAEFETYIQNNREFIPNFGERYRNGETISTAFVESTINQVVSRRFVKKQSMQWTLRGAHLLPQTRTKVLNEELGMVFRRGIPSPVPTERDQTTAKGSSLTPGFVARSKQGDHQKVD